MYKQDTGIIPQRLDKRFKITNEDRQEIKRLYNEVKNIREVARVFKDKCSRRTIQFVLFPERREVCRKQFRERRKDGRYYNKEYHRQAIAKVRERKRGLYKQGLLVGAKETKDNPKGAYHLSNK